jgi:hypothetical protein
MAEVIFDSPIVLCSANGKFRVSLEVADSGDLKATLLVPNVNDSGSQLTIGTGN